MENLDFLIKYLLEENKEVKVENISEDIISKKRLYRSLCNIRDVKPISEEYLKIENEYLQEELKNKVITEVKDIEALVDEKGDIKVTTIAPIVGKISHSISLGADYDKDDYDPHPIGYRVIGLLAIGAIGGPLVLLWRLIEKIMAWLE